MSGSSPRGRRSRSGRSSLGPSARRSRRVPSRLGTGSSAGLPSTQIARAGKPMQSCQNTGPDAAAPAAYHSPSHDIRQDMGLEARVGSAGLTMALGTCTVPARDSTTQDRTDAPQRRRAGDAGRRVRRTATLGHRAPDRGRRVLRRGRSRAGLAGAHHGRHRVARRGRRRLSRRPRRRRPTASGGCGSRP